jgi:hypothetical protein
LCLKEKGLFNLGIKDKVTKWLNPDATTADLGERMEAYYDEKLKVWVFPGEDPAEIAKPIGPPPTTVKNTINEPQTDNKDTNSNTNLDPLAAMMAPPKRGPAALSRSRTPIRPSPSSMPVMFPNTSQPTTQFTVFTPPPVPVSQNNDTSIGPEQVPGE